MRRQTDGNLEATSKEHDRMPAGLDTQSSTAPGAHEVVPRALTSLERSGAMFALLPGIPDAGSRGGEVDVLLRAADITTAERCLAALGWLRAHLAGLGAHRVHVMCDTATGTWHQLRLVTRLDFGPMQAYRTQLAEACLSRRARRDSAPVVHADDAFWLLFLDLAWQEATPSRWARLHRHAESVGARGPVADFLAALLPGGRADLEDALAAARANDWGNVRRVQRQVQRRWRRARLADVTRVHGTNWLLRRVSVARSPGSSLALLGLDGAGKTTVAARLHAEVPWPTVSLYMGVWKESSLDLLVRHFVGAQLALRLGRLARTNLVTRYHRALGRVVLLDRYIVDATLPSADLDWKGRISAVLVLRTAAAPDRLVFLDAPAEVVFARKGELTIEEARQRRDHYLEIREQYPQWTTVDADRPLTDVLADVSRILWEDLVRSRAATTV
jgi:thymidylate kinase